MINQNIRKAILVSAIGASSLLAGCASSLGVGESEYGCSGLPEGVQCMSAREVYDLTEQPGAVRADPKSVEEDGGSADRKAKAALIERQSGEGVTASSSNSEWSHPRASNNHPVAGASVSNDPMPIRTRAKIMRIWIAPWEAKNGDLNVSGMVFTELDERRWNVGTPAPEDSPTLSPLQSRESSGGQAQKRQPQNPNPANAGQGVEDEGGQQRQPQPFGSMNR